MQSAGRSLILILGLAVSRLQAAPRIVAVGDVHGAYPQFATILEKTGVIDAHKNWIGGSTILVQTGDILDRGPQPRACLDLLMKLEQQAPKSGGRVVAL